MLSHRDHGERQNQEGATKYIFVVPCVSVL
jgi:hypothetical protein